MSTPTYTSELPTEPGWYWWRGGRWYVTPSINRVLIETPHGHVFDEMQVHLGGCEYESVRLAGGEWAGPLEAPEQDESENDDE